MRSMEHVEHVFDLQWFLLHHDFEEVAQGVQVCFTDKWKVNSPSARERWLFAEIAEAYFLEVLSKSSELRPSNKSTNTFDERLLLCTVLWNISDFLGWSSSSLLDRRWRNRQCKTIIWNGTIHALGNWWLPTIGHSRTTSACVGWLEWWIFLQLLGWSI